MNSSIHGSFSTHKERIGAYRYVDNDRVKENYLIERLESKQYLNIQNRELLVLCDTTTILLNSPCNRIKKLDGLYPVGENRHKGKKLGFCLHSSLIVDESNDETLGVGTFDILDRPLHRKARGKVRKSNLRKMPFEQKESFKWVGPNIGLKQRLKGKYKRITFVCDREADVGRVLCQLSEDQSDFVIRSRYSRIIQTKQGKKGKLYEHISNSRIRKKLEITIRKGSRKRKVGAKLKFGSVILMPNKDAGIKEELQLNYVSIKSNVKNNKGEKINWILLTTRDVQTVKAALEIIEIYKRRWKIEVLFKLMKTDGFDIENTDLGKGKSIRKLAILIMEASLKVLMLKNAREGESDLKTKDVFSKEEIEILDVLNKKLEGKTKKQMNPYPKDELSWASWIIAVLGRWGVYSNRKPGNKTFVGGLDAFEKVKLGYRLLK